MNIKELTQWTGEAKLLTLDLPEKKLCIAIIERALRDYVGSKGLRGRFYKRGREANQREAEHWLFIHDGAFSLYWIADHISDEPAAFVQWVRTYATRLRESGRDVPTMY